MSLKIKDPDVARVIRSLRFHTEQSLAGFQAYIESDDGDSSKWEENAKKGYDNFKKRIKELFTDGKNLI